MLAVNTNLRFPISNIKIMRTERQCADVFVPCQALKGKCHSLTTGYCRLLTKSNPNKAIQAVLSGMSGIEVPSSSSSVEEFNITASSLDKDGKVKVAVEVSGTKTQEIYEEVFSKMVKDAQPIPGFRRAKGGKSLWKLKVPVASAITSARVFCFKLFSLITSFWVSNAFYIMHWRYPSSCNKLNFLGKTPDIPKHILLEILGPSNVSEQVIRKVINTATAQYVSKAGLNAGRDLQIEQSLEELEAGFEPGAKFIFDAIVQLQDLK